MTEAPPAPSRGAPPPAPAPDAPAANDARELRHHEALRALRADLAARGFFAPPRAAVPLVLVWLALWATAWTALLVLPLSAAWLAVALFCALAHLRMGFAGHDAGHHALHRKPWVNDLLGQLTMSVICGMCFDWWRYRHNKHHVLCQSVAADPDRQERDADPDMHFGVLFSVFPGSASWHSPLAGLFLRIQRYTFWPLTALYWISLRGDAIADLFRRRKHTRIDRWFFPLHVVLLVALPWLLVGGGRAVFTYVVVSSLSTVMTASVFAVNHIGLRRVAPGERLDFVEQQVTTSRNVANPGWADFYFGGLNFQIEHHLFPRVPHHRLRAMAPIVRAACARLGLSYCERTFAQAAADVVRHLGRMSDAWAASHRARRAARPARSEALEA